MEKEKIVCPHCGKDIEELVRAEVTKRIRQINVRKARESFQAGMTEEKKAERNRRGAEALRVWREKHPKLASALAERASHARSPEVHARQAQTMKETIRRKAQKFAELVQEAKLAGREITPEVESELLLRAREIVKAELRGERRARKKKKD